MRWYKKLYLGDSIKQGMLTKYRMLYSKKYSNYYCITLPTGTDCLLDMYRVSLLKSRVIDRSKFTVIGIAASKKEAMEVVRVIIEDVYTHTRGFDVGQYLGLTR